LVLGAWSADMSILTNWVQFWCGARKHSEVSPSHWIQSVLSLDSGWHLSIDWRAHNSRPEDLQVAPPLYSLYTH
jgi:hypothetical protein